MINCKENSNFHVTQYLPTDLANPPPSTNDVLLPVVPKFGSYGTAASADATSFANQEAALKVIMDTAKEDLKKCMKE